MIYPFAVMKEKEEQEEEKKKKKKRGITGLVASHCLHDSR